MSKYAQIAMMGSPEIYTICMDGEKPSKEYMETYNTLSSNEPEDVLELWLKFAYESGIEKELEDSQEYIVEEDADGIYLMKKIKKKYEKIFGKLKKFLYNCNVKVKQLNN